MNVLFDTFTSQQFHFTIITFHTYCTSLHNYTLFMYVSFRTSSHCWHWEWSSVVEFINLNHQESVAHLKLFIHVCFEYASSLHVLYDPFISIQHPPPSNQQPQVQHTEHRHCDMPDTVPKDKIEIISISIWLDTFHKDPNRKGNGRTIQHGGPHVPVIVFFRICTVVWKWMGHHKKCTFVCCLISKIQMCEC